MSSHARTIKFRDRAPPLLAEHSRLRLRVAVDALDLRPGACGTVVHVYGLGKGYEVEFQVRDKEPVVATLNPADIEPVPGE
jgi:hypothetical protein